MLNKLQAGCDIVLLRYRWLFMNFISKQEHQHEDELILCGYSGNHSLTNTNV